MARPLRLEFSGAVYHVTARGNARETIFADDRDRQRFVFITAPVSAHLIAHAALHRRCENVSDAPEDDSSRSWKKEPTMPFREFQCLRF